MKKIGLIMTILLCAAMAFGQTFGDVHAQKLVSNEPGNVGKFNGLAYVGCRGQVILVEPITDSTVVVALEYGIWGGDYAKISFYEDDDIPTSPSIKEIPITGEKTGILYLMRKQKPDDIVMVSIKVYSLGNLAYTWTGALKLKAIPVISPENRGTVATKKIEVLKSL